MAVREYQGPGGRYRAYFKFQGIQHSKIVSTKAEGREWEAMEKKRLLEVINKRDVLTYSVACEDYLIDVSSWMQPGTVQEKFSHYKAFAAYLKKDIPSSDVTLEIARKFIRTIQADKGNKSANRHLRNLKALWNWHIKEGRLSTNPWANVPALAEEGVVRRVPTQKDVLAVLLAAEPWEQDFLHMLMKTGARPGEIRRLQWDEVNIERRVIHLWTRKRRAGRKTYRIVPMNDTLHDILSRRWARHGHDTHVFMNPQTGEPWRKQNHPIRYMMERLCKKAGVEFFNLYALRHYTAQRLIDSGKASVVDVQKLLGHQRATTTDAYLADHSPDLARLGDALDDDGMHDESMHKRYAQDPEK
jgi:integrase